jgi:hypothetical protein
MMKPGIDEALCVIYSSRGMFLHLDFIIPKGLKNNWPRLKASSKVNQ